MPVVLRAVGAGVAGVAAMRGDVSAPDVLRAVGPGLAATGADVSVVDGGMISGAGSEAAADVDGTKLPTFGDHTIPR